MSSCFWVILPQRRVEIEVVRSPVSQVPVDLEGFRRLIGFVGLRLRASISDSDFYPYSVDSENRISAVNALIYSRVCSHGIHVHMNNREHKQLYVCKHIYICVCIMGVCLLACLLACCVFCMYRTSTQTQRYSTVLRYMLIFLNFAVLPVVIDHRQSILIVGPYHGMRR